MKKILVSLSVVAVVAAIAVGATTAFFSDTETSTGNTFTAGAIDLKVDNHAWYNGVEQTELSWELSDLDGHLFFNYTDLKPGDWEEDTISLHINNNPAWLCGSVTITKDDDMSSTEPELKVPGEVVEDSANFWDGELGSELSFIFWADDGDNVYESDETIVLDGTPSELPQGTSVVFPIADSRMSMVNPTGAQPLPVPGEETVYIGKAFCFGDFALTPVTQDGHGDQINPGGAQGPGFTCNGANATNISQTDSLMGDISFYAEQYRNNENFVCDSRPIVESRHISLENKDANWNIVSDDQIYGDIEYSHNDTTLHGLVTGTGLIAGGKYQITLNGPVEASGTCGFTNTSLGNFGSNAFEGGFWDSAAPNLSSTCTANDEEGLYNMSLVGDHYTFIADASGNFSYNFDYNLPAGDYSGVKVLVKKMLDTHVAPWADSTAVHGTNLYETASISFTIL